MFDGVRFNRSRRGESPAPERGGDVLTKAIRKSAESKVQAVLKRYQGRYIQITALLHELGGNEAYITRDTARKWLLRLGCVPKGNGLYWVPEPEVRAGGATAVVAEGKEVR